MPLGSPDIIGFTNGAATGALLQIIVFNPGPVEAALARGWWLGHPGAGVVVDAPHGLYGFRSGAGGYWCGFNPWRRSLRCWWCVLR